MQPVGVQQNGIVIQGDEEPDQDVRRITEGTSPLKGLPARAGNMWSSQGGGGDTGGGYMSSQGYGSSQQQGSQQPRSRAHTQSNVPCTIAQILRAEACDDGFVFDEIPIRQVTLVGIVRSMKESAFNLLYEIDDLSGPLLEARLFADFDDDTRSERAPVVREGVYARVHGHIRSFNNQRGLVASAVYAIHDFNELTNHLLEMVYMRARHRHAARTELATMGPASAADPTGGQPVAQAGQGGAIGPSGVSGPGQGGVGEPGKRGVGGPSQGGVGGFRGVGEPSSVGGGQMAPDIGLSAQQQQVLNVLRTGADERGVSVTTVCQHLKGVPQKVIRECIDFLSSEGHIYSTIDDEHYKSTDDYMT